MATTIKTRNVSDAEYYYRAAFAAEVFYVGNKRRSSATIARVRIGSTGSVRLTRVGSKSLQTWDLRLQVDAIRPTRQCDFL